MAPLLIAAVVIFAQQAPSGALPATALGVAGVFIAFLQWLVWVLWKDLRAKDAILLEKVLPVLGESAAAHRENAAATRSLAERAPTAEEMAQIRRLLQRRPSG